MRLRMQNVNVAVEKRKIIVIYFSDSFRALVFTLVVIGVEDTKLLSVCGNEKNVVSFLRKEPYPLFLRWYNKPRRDVQADLCISFFSFSLNLYFIFLSDSLMFTSTGTMIFSLCL